jgi:hypothetical protein
MKILTKWLTVPASNDVREIEVAQLWYVRWQSRHGEYYDDTQKEMEAFPSRQAAEEFAESLRNAFALVRHTSGNKVTVRPSEGDLADKLFAFVR